MAPVIAKKRKLEDGIRGKTSRPKKKFRKQTEYHSSSEDSEDDPHGDFQAVNLQTDSDSDAEENEESGKQTTDTTSTSLPDAETPKEQSSTDEPDEEDDEDDEVDSITNSTRANKTTSKRNDPNAFSTSISKILSTKLSQSARQDPVLSRSREATQASHEVANELLENKARAKIRAEKKESLDRGRVKDVLGLTTGEAGETAEEEKRLRKIAQRGVIKLFNAVRAAQVRGEEAAKEERRKGTVGLDNREERVNELSKKGFLDLINGKTTKTKPIEEA